MSAQMIEPGLPLGEGFEVEVVDHDPLDPHPDVPTPLSMVLRLTRPDRERRVERLTEMAWDRYAEARAAAGDKRIATVCLMFSGGKDSSTIAALFRDEFDTFVHADTGTGIKATRQFVRDTAEEWGKRLVMSKSDDDYFDLVLGKVRTKSGEHVWRGGFPGSGAHGTMQQRLKERANDKSRHVLGIANSRTECAIWIAGRRRPESEARRDVPAVEVDGSVIWSSPLVVWHKADLLTLRLMRPDVPVNPVSDVLGMSGECGCLANAHEGERAMWFDKYPNEPFLRRVLWAEALMQDPVALHRHYLESGMTMADAAATADRIYGLPERFKHWGMVGFMEGDEVSSLGRMCTTTCGDPLLNLMDPLFQMGSAA
jgi:3'-phosphoadenosine 5'-phosphosulfate sulfotransferase (PAPS reductase)/FAD synthetase